MPDNTDAELSSATESLRSTLVVCLEAVEHVPHTLPDGSRGVPSEKTLANLRNCVRHYTVIAKSGGMLPEHVLIRLKEVFHDAKSAPAEHELLLNAAVAWSLGAYFEGV